MKNTLFFFTFLFCFTAFGQRKDFKNVNIDSFITETQLGSEDIDEVFLAWWLPKEFWGISFAQDPTSSKEDYDAIMEIFEGYELFAIVKGRVGRFGGISYSSKEDIKNQLKVFYEDQELRIVPDINKAHPDLSSFISVMQPMMANMLGAMGENMNFFLLESSSNELLKVDIYSNKKIRLELGDFQDSINLPLSSLLIEKKCPKDGELYSGKWIFCPYHGVELKKQ